jgi:uncharacterized membrane protein YdfJ with MMPL/SSD domain
MCVFVFKLVSFVSAPAVMARRKVRLTPRPGYVSSDSGHGKDTHLSSFLYRLGLFCSRRAWLVLVAWLVVVTLVGAGRFTLGAQTSNDIRLPGTETQAATDFLAREFPPQQNGQSPVVFHAPHGKLTDPAARRAVEASVQRMAALPEVYSVESPFVRGGRGILLSNDGTTGLAQVLLSVNGGAVTPQLAAKIMAQAAPARAAGLTAEAGGVLGVQLSTANSRRSEAIGLIAGIVILAITFGTLVAAGMPIVTALVALLVGLGLIGFLGYVVDIPDVGPKLATMLGLGVGIDYALFIVFRFRDELHAGTEVREAVARAMATSGSAVVFAGTTVIIALLSLLVARVPLIGAMGYSSAVAVLVAVLTSITFLPAVLSLVGRRIDRLRLPWRRSATEAVKADNVWARWAGLVTRHPWISLVAALAVLLPLAAPTLTLILGQEDIGAWPSSSTQRRAFDQISRGFGPGANGRLVVAAAFDPAAEPSAAYTAKKAEAERLAKGLEAAAARLKRRGEALQRRGDALKADKAALERQAAALKIQQAQLQAQAAPLLARKNVLLAQQDKLLARKQRLQARGAALQAKAAALQQQGTSLAAQAQALGAQIAAVQAKIAQTTDPVQLQQLQAQLAGLVAQLQGVQQQIAKVQAQGAALKQQQTVLQKQGAALAADGKRLAAAGRVLQTDSAALTARGNALKAQGARLQSEGAALKRRAARLTREAAALKREKRRLERRGARAKELKKDLVSMLTDAGGQARATDPRFVRLQDALKAAPGVQSIAPPRVNKMGTAAVFALQAATRPADPKTADLVRRLRDGVVPQATHGQGVTAYVGGVTAAYEDLAVMISSRLPLVIGVVLALSFVVLLAAFRSVLVPLKAILCNLLAVGAAFGVLTAFFQWGWGLRLIGLENPYHSVAIASYVPLIMFAVLFGMSTDYEVFLISQIFHAHAEGMDTFRAVRVGVGASARVITAAAVIMVTVFLSFVLNPDPILKEFAIGLSVAILLDATIVRLVIVPAAMVLLGEWNWWLPRWLRWLPRVDLPDERAGVAAPADRPAQPEPAPAD